MSLQDFGRLWIASSDLTVNVNQVRRLFENGADTVVLKTAVREPPKGGKNYIIRNTKIIYYDFSKNPGLEQLLDLVPRFREDAVEGGFLEGFREIPEEGTISSYSHGGDAKLLTVDESNRLYRMMKSEFPDRHIVQSLGISREEDFELIDQLEGDAVELSLRYYHKFQSSPILLPNDPVLTIYLNVIKEAIDFEQNRAEVYNMTKRYASSRAKKKPVLLKLERRRDDMDYVAYATLDFDGFTACDSGRNVITNEDPRFGFRLYNKGKTSGERLLTSTAQITRFLKEGDPNRYISASGGILTPDNAAEVLMNGVNSVQLCSTIYLNRFDVVRDFARIYAKTR